jgi:hypothetical protein
MPSITGLSLSPHGVDAALVNISTTGLLAECGTRLKTGDPVKVVFGGSFTVPTVQGRVVRACVASMSSGGIRYHVGICFNTAVALEGEVAAPAPKTETAPAVAVVAAASAAAATEPPVLVNRW